MSELNIMIEQYLQNKDLLNSLIAISTGVATIYIPLALVLFQNWHEEVKLNKLLALDGTIKPFQVGSGFVLLFLPLLTFAINSKDIKFFSLLVWFLGLFLAISGMVRIYNWIRNDRHSELQNFLSNSKWNEEYVSAIRIIWDIKDLSDDEQKKYFIITKNKFAELFKLRKTKNLQTIMYDLRKLTEHTRKEYFLTSDDDIFDFLIYWNYIFYNEEVAIDENGKQKIINTDYWGINHEVENQIKIVIERTLKGSFTYSLFKKIENFLISKKSDARYMQYVIPMLLRQFFEKINKSPDSRDIADHYYPQILKYNPEDREISNIIFSFYLRWFVDMLNNTEDKNEDFNLDKITNIIFPNIDIKSFTGFVEFIASPYGEDRILDFLNRKKSFGLLDFNFISWSGGEISDEEVNKMLTNKIESKFKNTIFILKTFFTNPKIKKEVEDNLARLSEERYSNKKFLHEREMLKKVFLGYLNTDTEPTEIEERL